MVKINKKDIAIVCHQLNKIYCEVLADFSQLDWKDAEEWQKESAINGVLFHLENPNAGDSASHDSWMKEKLDNGWVHGDVKNPNKKEHPCIVPFDELPTEQQIKDKLFRQTVHSLKALM